VALVLAAMFAGLFDVSAPAAHATGTAPAGLHQVAVAATQKKAKKATSKRPTTRRKVLRRTTTTRPLVAPTTLAIIPSTVDPSTVAPSTIDPNSLPTTPSTVAPGSTLVPPTTLPLPTPQVYLERVLKFIETYSARSRIVDIGSLTAAARAKGANVATIAETYPIIKEVLVGLGDRHSQLLDPTTARSLLQGSSTGYGIKIYPPDVIWVTAGSPADVGGIKTLDRIVSFNGKPWSKTTAADRVVETAVVRVFRANVGEFDVNLTRGPITTNETPTSRVLDSRLGYLDLPGSTGTRTSEENFGRVGISAIGAVEATSNPCGWVLDLRRNSGGFVYSMMSVLEPFLTESTFAGFVFGDDRRELLSFKGGQLYAGGRLAWKTDAVAKLRDPNVPVAILMSNFTGSAGELAAISFIGRAGSRSFGDKTVGVTSANVGITLADGAFIMVTNSYDLDRSGTVYDQKLQPDVAIPLDWTTYGTDADPVLTSARQWLSSQPACAGR
jgi:carboxyl-terminal processing protease